MISKSHKCPRCGTDQIALKTPVGGRMNGVVVCKRCNCRFPIYVREFDPSYRVPMVR